MTVTVDRVAGLLTTLHQLGRAAPRIARKAMKAGATVVARHQKAAARNLTPPPKHPGKHRIRGTIPRSIGSRTIKASGNFVGAKAGVSVGKKTDQSLANKPAAGLGPRLSAPHAHLVAMGTDQRYRGVQTRGHKRAFRVLKSGKTKGEAVVTKGIRGIRWTGQINPGRAFVRTGFTAGKSEATGKIIGTLEKEILKEATKR